MSSENCTWSFGKKLFDSYPVNYEGSIEELVAFIKSNAAPKKGDNYITSAMASSEAPARRCKANALPRSWIAFDNDGELSDEVFLQCTEFFATFRCIVYETASSNPNARRFRVIVFLTEAVAEEHAKAIGDLVQRASGVPGWDSSTHRAAQPIFLQPVGNLVTEFKGKPLDVAYWLSKVPPKPKPKRVSFKNKPSDNIFGWFANNGLVVDVGAAKHTVICPWSDLHSDGRLEAALFEPSPDNNMAWGFKCLHSHCEHRSIKDVYSLVREAA